VLTSTKTVMSIQGTRLSGCFRVEKPLGAGAQAWRQHPTAYLGIAVSTTDNSTRVSEVEHRHR
jgi:hypothetical protein